MSEEFETTNAVSIPTKAIPKISPEKTTPLTCTVCHATIADNDVILICNRPRCLQATCAHCVKLMLRLILAQPSLNYPLQCGSCQNSFDDIQFNSILVEDEQYEKYMACLLPLFWSKCCLECNEELVQCKCSITT
jgi:hypothetical protein